MPAPRVVLIEPIHPAGIALLRAATDVVVLDGPDDARAPEVIARADAMIVRSTPVGAGLIAAGPRLRVIGRHGAGLDNIDLAAAESAGIAVINTPRSNTESVAEYVVGAMFQLVKRMDEVRAALREGAFSSGSSLPGQVDRLGLIGREIGGLRMGLVGAGAIGRAVAGRASALGMSVGAYDPFVSAAAMSELGMGVHDSLESLLAASDVVSLHLPGGPEARGIISAARLSLMPSGSVLINAARGGLVDTEALVEAVRTGRLAGAAVDVFDHEPPAVDAAILHTPGIIATPHMAAMTAEALERMAVDVAKGVLEALDTSCR
jgi:D-3-phosphoglycerate dehydrogenase